MARQAVQRRLLLLNLSAAMLGLALWAFFSYLKLAGLPGPLAVLASTTSLKAATAAGVGPCVLSELAVATEVAPGALVAVDVEGLELGREFRALWRAAANDAEVQRFVRLARATGRRP
jgi:DNA-binding transcriptional LysR family regulator